MDSADVQLLERFRQLQRLLEDRKIAAQPERLRSLTQEYQQLKVRAQLVTELEAVERSLLQTQQLAAGADRELAQLAAAELPQLQRRTEQLSAELRRLSQAEDALEHRNLILEIRAGTGGGEAALFAADLFRMYSRYAEQQGWRVHVLSASRTDLGGWKEIVASINGRGAFGQLRFESGTHRVQRIPTTEKSGRVHTSTATVAVLPEAEEVEVALKPADCKVDVFRSGGHGGQSVNTTDSAIRITHLPTGIVVTCQDERSQRQNKAKALAVLRARLFQLERDRRERERGVERRAQIKSAQRAEKVRTYNVPQNRVTDHRIQQSWHNLKTVLDGGLGDIIAALKQSADAPATPHAP